MDHPPAPRLQPPAPRWSRWGVIAILTLGVVAVYAWQWNLQWKFDDISAIAQNFTIRSLNPIIALTPPTNTAMAGRPVANYSLALNFWISKDKPWSYQLTNRLLHLATALLLFGTLWRCLDRRWVRQALRLSPRTVPWVAGGVTLIWAVHPIQTENVVYVTQRTGMLVSFFIMLTVYACTRAWGSRRPGAWTVLATAACVLGMGAKEVMVITPVLVLLLDRAIFLRSWRGLMQLKRRRVYLTLAATWGVFVPLAVYFDRNLSVGYNYGVGAVQYLQAQAGVILMYFRMVFWPHGLAIFHDVPLKHTPVAQWLPAGLVILALLAITLGAWFRRGWAWLGLLGAWVFLLLAPTSSFLPIVTEPAAERRMYLPSFAVLVGATVGLLWLMRSRPGRRTLVGLTVAGAVVLGVVSFQRISDYKTRISIWRAAYLTQPHSAYMLSTYAATLHARGDTPGAVVLLRDALKLEPDDMMSNLRLAMIYNARGQHKKAIAMLKPLVHFKSSKVYYALGLALRDDGQLKPAERALIHAYEMRPDHDAAPLALAKIYTEMGRLADAERAYRLTLNLNPLQTEARYGLGHLALISGHDRQAIEQLLIAVRQRPRLPMAWADLGMALSRVGQPKQSIQAFEQALRLDDQNAEYHNNFGSILGKFGHMQRAAEQFEAALRVDPDYPEARRNLARARQRLADSNAPPATPDSQEPDPEPVR